MADFELKIRSRDIGTLLRKIKNSNPDIDLAVIQKAYLFANAAHEDQFRLSGEPYIVHPLEVGLILAEFKLDTDTIAAALLHDTVEDTGTTLDMIEKVFGREVAQMVDGVTKISSIKSRTKATAQAATLRKMLLATVKDVRVIIIKLADKLHNMRTIMFQPPETQERVARETLEIYAPLARRLGMSKISSELEDLAFRVLEPDAYNDIKNSIAQRNTELEAYLDNVRNLLLERLRSLNIDAEITGRAKHYYSIHKKIMEQKKSFEEIYDIRAIRIITSEIRDCYGVLGVVHTLWSPIISRFKDFIAVPKSNMYQSLHTTVIGPDGHRLEVQIRTHKMHATAEMGIAAHWLYKEDPGALKKNNRTLAFLKDITQRPADLRDTREFMKNLKMDLYDNEIFVFTPKGKIIKLPAGATPIDFAYAIHTQVGNTTVGARVNNAMASLKTKLKSGDIIEIMTSKKGHPSESWLKLVASPGARNKIRSWLRRQLEAELKTAEEEKHRDEKRQEDKSGKDDKTVPVAIPQDEQIKLKSISRQKKTGITVNGASNVLIRLSQCCQPIPGDDVVGFITRGRGITVHKRSCPSLKRLSGEPERIINIVWEGSPDTLYPIKVAVEAIDRPNLLKDVADEISLGKTNIIKAEAHVQEGKHAVFKFILEVRSNDHLKEIIARLRNIKNVTDVYKLNEKVILK
ncbi:MAG: bifunctional (p)ppGpp synthetase/guanosine-3',5'-bis(diphosphate) 3'-pyrophosphohydrolase [Spirochaetes bacterium]|nr:bifunctional (p)ppGpp synthetase/guanosine-3',5'-bis(diphosphate) 3'-pyrophosphohydrolase [Spirochaetota bacterium]